MTETASQLLVLGAGLNPDSSAAPQTRERALVAHSFYESYGAERVIFSGGRPLLAPELADGPSEAQVMAGIATTEGLPDELVRTEESSITMLGNFINSSSLLDPQINTVVIAHHYQLPRALYIGRKLLTATVEGFNIAEPDDAERAKQEQLMLWVMKTVLAGVQQGDIATAKTRNSIVEGLAGWARPLISGIILRRHTALGS